MLGNKVAARNAADRRRRAGDAGHRRRCRATWRECKRLAAGSRLSADAQGQLGRRRARHAGARKRAAISKARWPRPGAKRWRRSATTRSISRSWCAARATSRCRSSATRTATGASLRARLHGAAAQPEGGRACARAVPRSMRPRRALCDSALRLMRAVGYTHAGTVEFLMDADTGKFYFIEVNPRIQVEHTVTEVITGIDIVKAQIRITEGGRIGLTEDELVGRRRQRSRRRRAGAGGDSAERPCAAMPHHDRGSRERLPARLRPAHRVPQRGRLRHPARRRHRLWRRGHHAVLRFAAGQGDRLGADGGRDRSGAWTARCANSAFAASRRTCSSSRTSSIIRPSRRGDVTTRFIDMHARAARLREAARPRDQAAALPRRSDASTAIRK